MAKKETQVIPIVDLPREEFDKYFKAKIKPLYNEKLLNVIVCIIPTVILSVAIGMIAKFIINSGYMPDWLEDTIWGFYGRYDWLWVTIIFIAATVIGYGSPFWKLIIVNKWLSKKLKTKLFKAIDYEYYKGCFDLQEFQPVWDYFGLKKTTREIVFGKLHSKPFFVMLYEKDRDNLSILFGAKTNKPFSSEIVLKEKEGAPSIHLMNKKLNSPKVFLQDFFAISLNGISNPAEFFTKKFTTKLLEYKKNKDAQISVLFSSKYSEEKNVYFCISAKKIYWDYFDTFYMGNIFKQSKYLSKFLKEIDRLLDIVATLEQK